MQWNDTYMYTGRGCYTCVGFICIHTCSVVLSFAFPCKLIQVGTWAGNLMLTHDNDNFPSDVFTVLAAVGASITIGQFRLGRLRKARHRVDQSYSVFPNILSHAASSSFLDQPHGLTGQSLGACCQGEVKFGYSTFIVFRRWGGGGGGGRPKERVITIGSY